MTFPKTHPIWRSYPSLGMLESESIKFWSKKFLQKIMSGEALNLEKF